jgi:hypothetical protein
MLYTRKSNNLTLVLGISFSWDSDYRALGIVDHKLNGYLHLLQMMSGMCVKRPSP